MQKPRLTGYINLTAGRLRNPSLKLIRPKGIRTYRLIVKTGESGQNFGLIIDNIRMSSRLYVDGNLRGTTGTPAAQNQGYQERGQSNEAYFRSQGTQTEILLQTANYDYPFYGTQYTILLGLQKQISASSEMAGAVELCGVALSFLFGFFYLSMFMAHKKDKGWLFAALEFFSLTVTVLVTGKKLLYAFFPSIPFELFGKVQALSIFAVIISIVAYSKTVHTTLSDRFAKIVYAVGLVYFVLVFLTPNAVYVSLNGVCDCFVVMVLFCFLWRLQRLYKTSVQPLKRAEIILNSFCVGTLLIAFGNTFLYNFSWVPTTSVGAISSCAFFLLSMYAIVFRFITNYDIMVRMDRVKDEFITRTSYELKAPLGSILNLCESGLGKDHSAVGASPETIQTFTLIHDIAAQLLRVVNATLDVTLLQNGQLKLHFSPVSLASSAGLAAESAGYIVQGKNITIRTDFTKPLMASADESRVRQILLNLIANSVNSMEQGTIQITGKQIGDTVSVTVEDDGCGIPESRRADIFAPYQSLNARGVGLGLYLSRLLAEQMGGELRLEWSEIDKGSRFRLTLPRSHRALSEHRVYHLQTKQLPKTPFPVGGEHGSPVQTGNTILIVDSEIVNIQTASHILHRNGYRILTAFSGEEARGKIESSHVDLIILDISLPGSSGIATCRKIREKYSLIELPVLLSTVGNVNNDLDLGLDAGANDFIMKPFEEKEMLARVRTLTALKKSMEDTVQNELAFLQAQIKPHFVYNAINTIISFCYTDGERAAKLLTNFSKYLRLTFDVDRQSFFEPLRREIEMIRAFIEIEQARFGDKIRIEYDIDENLLDREIPPLIIQPLVENAIKHGLREKEEGGLVTVTVKDLNGAFIIIVRDGGIGMPPEQVERLKNFERVNDGVGLINVNRRVRRWKNAHMDISSTEGVGTTITITVNR